MMIDDFTGLRLLLTSVATSALKFLTQSNSLIENRYGAVKLKNNMEESWINLPQKTKRRAEVENEDEEGTNSGPSTTSSSIESINSAKEGSTRSGGTNEKLRASYVHLERIKGCC